MPQYSVPVVVRVADLFFKERGNYELSRTLKLKKKLHFVHTAYCDMTPENWNSEVRIDLHL
jgi:hypothetical protein